MLPVEETFAKEEDAVTVRRPVDDAKVKARLELAPPPKIPKSTWVSTPEEKEEPVEVEYLLPWKSKRVAIVELGLLNSDEEATPVGPIVKYCCPVFEATVSKFPVWFKNPRT